MRAVILEHVTCQMLGNESRGGMSYGVLHKTALYEGSGVIDFGECGSKLCHVFFAADRDPNPSEVRQDADPGVESIGRKFGIGSIR